MTAIAMPGEATMKAIRQPRYGSPDVLELREADVPEVDEGRVLLRVHAASVNALDWHMLRGEPFLVRMTDGLRAPKSDLTGSDVAGVVEAVGRDVKELKVGDHVFGSTRGSFAELVRAREKYLVMMPQGFTFEQAAAVPVAATTALQAVRDKARVAPGQKVMVNGAGGGVGTFVVQIAKAHGATVTAVSSAGNLEMLRSIGADEVIDYAKDDITTGSNRYDVLFDLAGNRSIGDYRRVVTDDGAYVVIGGQSGRWIKPMDRVARMMLTDRFTRQRLVFFLAQINRDDLLVLRELMESGKLTPVIGTTYPLDQVPDAIRQMEAGHAQGKIVITVP